MKKEPLSDLFNNKEKITKKKTSKDSEEVKYHAILRNELETQYATKVDRPTVEETHRRVTFLLRNDLNDELNELAKDYKRGFKSSFLNTAVEILLESYKNE